ncbi:hypothetical protein, partial [Lysobacter enzymogenes]|uniref:hypothetical protein n=1 Tax=Lysobacter enzymogenes TaxID=69 RepID=UPI00197B9BB3
RAARNAAIGRDLCGRFGFRLIPAAMSKGYVRDRFPIMPAAASKPPPRPSQRSIDRRIIPAPTRN